MTEQRAWLVAAFLTGAGTWALIYAWLLPLLLEVI